jgi:hypothetical protein
MNAEPKIEQATQEQPKSKRLSSLVWILVLWGFVRLVSEMDGISWERAFPDASIIFGLYPATLFLVLAIVSPVRLYQRALRWTALISVLGSFLTILFFDKQSQGIQFIVWEQRLLVFITMTSIAVHWAVKKEKQMTTLTPAHLQQQFEGTRLAAAAYAAADIKTLLSTNPRTHQLSAGLHKALFRQGFNTMQVNSKAINFGSACNELLERKAA